MVSLFVAPRERWNSQFPVGGWQFDAGAMASMRQVNSEADFSSASCLFHVTGGRAAVGNGVDQVAHDGGAGGEVANRLGDIQQLRRGAAVLPLPRLKPIVNNRQTPLVADNIEGRPLAAAGREIELDVSGQPHHAATGRIQATAGIWRFAGEIVDKPAYP